MSLPSAHDAVVPYEDPVKEAQQLFDHFDPFPERRGTIERLHAGTEFADVILVLAFLVLLFKQDKGLLIFVAVAAIWSIYYLIAILIRDQYNKDKMEQFLKHSPEQAAVLIANT
jgi:hypothetical protein